MKFPLPFLLIAFLLTFGSCSKENEEEEILIVQSPYLPLALDNFWIYDFQNFLPDGTPTGSVNKDTMIVVGDTLINGASFWIVNTDRPTPGTEWYLRDATGTIINSSGTTFVTDIISNDLYDEHYIFAGADTVAYVFSTFPDTMEIPTVEGQQNCLMQLTTHELWPNFGGQTIIDTSYFASFGLAERSYSYASGAKLKGTLVEYHLE